MSSRNIAIDGPAGAGKSTVGEQLAQQLGYLYIDTGAMYRAAAWLALREGIETSDARALLEVLEVTQIRIGPALPVDGRQYTVTLDGQDITWELREPYVTRTVPLVSRHPEVRNLMRERQRQLASSEPVVMVGRDIGAVVLPDALLKLFLTASPRVRARRRQIELRALAEATQQPVPDIEEILSEILRRDALDSANSRPAPGATWLLTDDLSVDQVVEQVCKFIQVLQPA